MTLQTKTGGPDYGEEQVEAVSQRPYQAGTLADRTNAVYVGETPLNT